MNIFSQAIVRVGRMNPVKTGWIDDCLCAVNLDFVNAYLYQKDGHIVCFDPGYGRSALLRELSRLGVDPGRVSHVFLTHSDFDHAGNLNVFPNAKVFLSEDEERLIARGRARPRRFLGLRNPRLKRPYELLGDGDTVLAGGIEVKAIKTPGHTPGSMSYLTDGRILFTGDTFALKSGRAIPNKSFTMDIDLLRVSAAALSKLMGVKLLVTAHSGMAAYGEATADRRRV